MLLFLIIVLNVLMGFDSSGLSRETFNVFELMQQMKVDIEEGIKINNLQ